MALDQNLAVLLAETVVWQRSTGIDGYGDHAYADPVTLACRVEDGTAAIRTGDSVDYVPAQILYLSGDDLDAQQVTLDDRFAGPGIGGGQTVQPKQVRTIYGPAGDAWFVWVAL